MKRTAIIGVFVGFHLLAASYAEKHGAPSGAAATHMTRHDDLAFLCDANEAYFRAEASVIVVRDPSLAAYMDAFLAIRLADLGYQRHQLENIPSDDRLPFRVANEGWCALQIGDNQTFSAPTDLAEILKAFERHHPNAYAEYVALIKKWREEILRKSGINRAQWDAISRRYMPSELDRKAPNKSPEPAAGAVH